MFPVRRGMRTLRERAACRYGDDIQEAEQRYPQLAMHSGNDEKDEDVLVN